MHLLHIPPTHRVDTRLAMASYGQMKSQTYPYDPAYRGSSRQLYPTFLSVGESAQLQARWAWQGLYDAFRWNVLFRTLRK